MKLIYLTSKTFPPTTADHFFVREMSRGFAAVMQKNFLLVVWNDPEGYLRDIPHYSLGRNSKKGKKTFFKFWLPFFIISRNLRYHDVTFFSNDKKLIAVLLFWKKWLKCTFRVVSDWHMISDDEDDLISAKESDGLVTTTKHLKNLIVERFRPPHDKILAAYGGVDMERVESIQETKESIRRRLGLSDLSFLIGYVGFFKTLGIDKGIGIMIDALALMGAKNVQMVFVGGKEEEIEEYKAYALAKGVQRNIIFVPVVPSIRVAEYEKAMDILVIPYPNLPHFRDYGFPMKAYEYMAAQKLIVFSNLPIMAEVLGDCAVPFAPGSSEDLAKKIIEVGQSPENYTEHIARAYEKAKDCTWQNRAQRIVDFTMEL